MSASLSRLSVCQAAAEQNLRKLEKAIGPTPQFRLPQRREASASPNPLSRSTTCMGEQHGLRQCNATAADEPDA
jgi:hypothetical protein